jgi:hypothetical protein
MTRSYSWKQFGIGTILATTLISQGLGAQTRNGHERLPTKSVAINPRDHNLDIVAIAAPAQLEQGQPLHVAVTAADRKGVSYIKVSFGEETRWFAAGGDRVASFSTVFERTLLGIDTIQATAFGEGGRLQGPTRTLEINVIDVQPFKPREISQFIPGDANYAEEVNPNFPFPQNPPGSVWWKWWSANYAKPYPWQSLCPNALDITPGGEVLHCWLNNNPQVRSRIVWAAVVFTGEIDDLGTAKKKSVDVPYDQWNALQKSELDIAFYHAYQYLKSGGASFGGTPLPDKMPNEVTLADDEPPYTIFKATDVWNLYVGTIAHSLAVEIGGFMPWSVVSYKPEDLDLLFSANYFVKVGYFRWTGPSQIERSVSGYAPYESEAFAAPAVTAFNFLLAQDTLRSSQFQTIGKMIEFGRDNQSHMGFSSKSPLNNYPTLQYELFWEYRGAPPVVSMMKKHWVTDPFTNKLIFGKERAFSRGCWGESEFLQAVLRTANIPIDVVPVEARWGGGGHGTMHARTANLALAHGDDPYSLFWVESTPQTTASSVLINLQTFDAWFNDPSIPMYHHLPHALIDVGLKGLANVLLQNYCSDKKLNLAHDVSSVYNFVDPGDGLHYYTVQQLENVNLWTNLGVKAAKLNYCQ